MRLLGFFVLISLFACSPMLQTAGKCYTKVDVPDEYETYTIQIIEYTGTDFDNPFIDKVKDIIVPESANWVKKKADKNCLSADPNDCLVWCLVKTPEKAVEYYSVSDTNEIKEFKVRLIEEENLIKNGGIKNVEVLCEKQLTESILMNITDALALRGYPTGALSGVFLHPNTIESLNQYQEENSFPVGSFNIETLKALEVL